MEPPSKNHTDNPSSAQDIDGGLISKTKSRKVADEEIVKIITEEKESYSRFPKYPGLERWALLEKMGDGAFSNVYRARDRSGVVSGEVAIKVVRKYEMNVSQVCAFFPWSSRLFRLFRLFLTSLLHLSILHAHTSAGFSDSCPPLLSSALYFLISTFSLPTPWARQLREPTTFIRNSSLRCPRLQRWEHFSFALFARSLLSLSALPLAYLKSIPNTSYPISTIPIYATRLSLPERAFADQLQRANILKEVAIMRKLDHPNIIRLIEFSEAKQYYYIVLELAPGGELFHQIVKLTYFSEELSRHVIVQVAKALEYLHEEQGVVHRLVTAFPTGSG